MNDIREMIRNNPLIKAIMLELNENEKKQIEDFTEVLVSKLESSFQVVKEEENKTE